MIKYIVILVTLSLACACQRDVNTKETYTLNSLDYDPEILEMYDKIHTKNRFLFAKHPDTLRLAISLMDELLEYDDNFIPAYKSRFEYECRLGEKKEAVNTLKTIFLKEPENIYVLPSISMVYEQMNIVDSSSYYMNLSIEKFERRCNNQNCNEADYLNLIFLKLYRGDITIQSALEIISEVLNEDDYSFYAAIIRDFDRRVFLNSHCKKIVDK